MARNRRRPAPSPQPVAEWKLYRPAIWLGMLGVAVGLLVSPWYLCALPLGAALGIALKIRRRRR